MKFFNQIACFCMILLIACNTSENQTSSASELIVEGSWHMEFQLSPNNILPVDLTINKTDTSYSFHFLNADEVVTMTNVTISSKKIIIKDPIFNTWFEGEIVSPTQISGFWFKDDKTYKIPFEATQNVADRFPKPDKMSKSQPNISGTWEVDFGKNSADQYKAIGQFQQVDNYVSGTFMTETGDYRFLEGNMYNNNLYLSCFDGAHLFLFKASLINNVLEGNFWSGNHWEEPWTAIKNEQFKLTNPDSLTYLKKGFSTIDFKFPNINGDSVSLADEKYKGKVVIVNIMGPWCPNCKDETIQLTELYNKYHKNGLEIIALSFDKTNDIEQSKKNIERIQHQFNSKYDFLIAGKASKIDASKSLPMLNQIISYPTTIFIDRKGNVRKIRTGFYGPGTGTFYKKYDEEINLFIQEMLNEK